MAGITFRGLLGRIEELERARRANRYVTPYWSLTAEQRTNPNLAYWYIRNPDNAARLFLHFLGDTRHTAACATGGHDREALDAFGESEPFLEWVAEVLSWDPHDGRYLSLLEQRETIWSWYAPLVTVTMCPDWPAWARRLWANDGGWWKACQTRLDRLPGEPIPCEVPATMSLPTAKAVHQKRLELWEKCQRYGTEPTMEETAEWYERRFGDGLAESV